MNQNNTSYRTRIDSDKEKTEHLQNKLKELEEKETALIEKLKNTYDVHKTKYHKYEQVFQTKVTTDKPIELPEDEHHEENHNAHEGEEEHAEHEENGHIEEEEEPAQHEEEEQPAEDDG